MRAASIGWGIAGAGALGLTYAAGFEVRSFRLRRVQVPVLPAGQRPLRVLHLSDLHLVPRQYDKRAWVRGLAALEPDLVVNTGDNLAHADAVPAVLDSLAPLLQRPGVFVLGSNDRYRPVLKNPVRYLLGSKSAPRLDLPLLPTGDLVSGLTRAGWADLDNATTTLEVDGRRLAFVGVDDVHLDADQLPSTAPDPDADLVIGVTHSPYQRMLNAMTAAPHSAGLVLAGHTHGGQLCIPGFGALITNCDLPRDRAKGLSRWNDSWLHVSAGLGTSPYTPVRFACPPEATLLTLVGTDCPAEGALG